MKIIKLKIKIEGEGTFVVPGKFLIDIVRKLDAQTIEFNAVEENIVKVFADSYLKHLKRL